MQIQTGQPYAFGPFQLALPDGWEAEFEDGVHEIAPPNGDFVIQINGYSKDALVSTFDLRDMADGQSNGATVSDVELPSGLDGLTFDTSGDGHANRYWLIRFETALIAVTLTTTTEDLALAAIPAQMVVSSVKPSGE